MLFKRGPRSGQGPAGPGPGWARAWPRPGGVARSSLFLRRLVFKSIVYETAISGWASLCPSQADAEAIDTLLLLRAKQ